MVFMLDYSQFGVILSDIIFEEGLSWTFSSDRYCNFTLSALSSVFTTYL